MVWIMNESRRRFLSRALGTGAAVLLSGCDRLSRTEWFPRVLGSAEALNRTLHHALASRHTLAQEFSEADLSPVFPSNGTAIPGDRLYQSLAADGFRRWRLDVGGLVAAPRAFSLAQLQAMPARTQITRHDCVEGWSAIGKWTGVPLSRVLDVVRPLPAARFVVFYCADPMDRSGQKYYESIDFEDAYHPQTQLSYALNDAPLPIRNGAPLRLRVERQLGYKMAKYLMRVELVEDFRSIAGGRGGYWEDQGYEWYAGI
jgi:DMSO/TMAO reductase YedYZ molybdopterin-dependent catalytic subunit